MAEEKKNIQLNDEELKRVNGGGSGSYNGVTYTDGDVFVESGTPTYMDSFKAYKISNCTETTCDLDEYVYIRNLKEFSPTGNGKIWSNLPYVNIIYRNLVKMNPEDL